MPYPTDPIVVSGIWAALILTLATYSYVLYKETYAFRFAEHAFMATTFAVAVVVAVQTLMSNTFLPISQGDWSYVIPIILGLLMYAMPFKQYRWIARYPIALIVGVGTGVAIRGAVQAQVVGQVLGAITLPSPPTPINWFNFFFSLITFVTSTSYFIFTKEHTGLFKYPTKIGRYALMLALGSYFGNTVLFRMSMLAGRVQDILKVLGIIPF
jgi:hypothetical protein